MGGGGEEDGRITTDVVVFAITHTQKNRDKEKNKKGERITHVSHHAALVVFEN